MNTRLYKQRIDLGHEHIIIVIVVAEIINALAHWLKNELGK